MTTLNILLLALGLLLLGFALLVSRQPKWMRVTRSAVLSAPRERLFDLVNSFPAWRQWSPWEGLDPALQREYSGPASGVGAAYHWTGNAKVGEGRMEITVSEPPSRVQLQLTFIKPFASSMVATFDFIETPDGTRVTWTNEGPNSLPGRIFGVFMNMDRMMGEQFEKGLAQLEAAALSQFNPQPL